MLVVLTSIVTACSYAALALDPSKCHETCIISPTACEKRLECAGCGVLCFGADSGNPAFDRLLDATGTSLQTTAEQAFIGNAWEKEVRSADFVLQWRSIELSPGVYDWSPMTAAVARAQKAGKKITFLLWTGQDSPEWLYDKYQVERLAWNNKENGGNSVPNYMNAKYQERLKAVHQALSAELKKSHEPGGAVIAFQPCLGSTGDDTPIHSAEWDHVDQTLLREIGGSGSGSESTWWQEFFRGMALWLRSSVFPQENFALLLNAQGSSFPLDWIAAKLPGTFLKFGQNGHEYQSNYERFRVASFVPYVYSLQNGRPVRSRAELSGETCWTSEGKYTTHEHQPWNFYAMTQWVASAHLDFWNLQPGAAKGFVDNMQYAPLWRFLNRYAGMRWAGQSRGAWIGFRDGLDAMDTARFNQSYYGMLHAQTKEESYPTLDYSKSHANKERALKIQAEFAAQGCKIEVPEGLVGGPMTQRRMKGMNDVAFGNWQGDYGGFMRQTNPATSAGWWRIGSDSQMFGRFARGFASPKQPSATIGLTLDCGMWGGLPLKSKHDLTLRLIFFDSGKGAFSVHYDAQSGPRNLVSVSKKGSGLWRELCAVVPDARFGGHGPGEADIWLSNDDTEDDIFDSMEVAEGTPEELSLQGCDWSNDNLVIRV